MSPGLVIVSRSTVHQWPMRLSPVTQSLLRLTYSLKLVAGSSRSLDAWKLVPRGAGKIPGCTESWLLLYYGSYIGWASHRNSSTRSLVSSVPILRDGGIFNSEGWWKLIRSLRTLLLQELIQLSWDHKLVLANVSCLKPSQSLCAWIVLSPNSLCLSPSLMHFTPQHYPLWSDTVKGS